MNRLLLILLCLASAMLASEVNLKTPSTTLQSYYDAINEGDSTSLKQIMTNDSYDTDVQIYALSIALKDKKFHKRLKQYAISDNAKRIVEKAVEKKLKMRKKRKIIIDKEISLGDDRVMVKFTEESKKKQLYFSHHTKGWQLNYLAGRKTK